MVIAALVIASVGLLCALAALSKASSFARRIEEAELAAKRRTENLAEELKETLELQRELLARVAEGAAPSREMIIEGRLWSDADGAKARELVAAGARVLDVRTPAETAQGVIPGALLIPIDSLESRAREIPSDRRPLLVYCAGGGRSAAACEFLARSGVAGLHNLSGGIGAWGGNLARPS